MKFKCLIMFLLVSLIAGSAMADQVILSPTGRVLTLGQAKIEGAFNADDTDDYIAWLNIGIPRVELQAIRVGNPAGNDDTGFGAELLVLPETIITPAVGLGVRDVTDETSLGRAFYVAATKSIPGIEQTQFIRFLRVSGGLGIDNIEGIFAGVEIGLPFSLTGYAEYDSENFNFALGWNPIQPLQVKAYWIDEDFYFGGRFSIGL